MATIVLKLFHLVPADVAFFGQKDYQQSLVVRQMVADLNIPIEIRVCPTVREVDGLALSSRNRFLSADERRQALALSRSLDAAQQMVAAGQRDASLVAARMRKILTDAAVERIDYVALADPEDLTPRRTLDEPTIALVAAHIGRTRLIDNARIR